MGHIHLGTLPKSKKWRDVVGEVTEGAPDRHVVAASAIAAEKEFLAAADDPVFVEAVRLLLAIPYAARSEDFAAALREADLQISGAPGVMEIVAASMARLDEVGRERGRPSDLGELASRALARTLTDCISSDLPGLFAATAEDVRLSARGLSYSKGVAYLTRAYFGSLVGSVLSYWLDRALPLHIGETKRFDSVSRRSAFDNALQQYTTEATRIIQEFAGGWYGKTLHEKGEITTNDALIFGAVSLKKINAELRERWVQDA
ncbi:hypothetical protein O5O51_10500 [Sinirhodobacter sp. HNIBRBA609]|nr:hypothetical protein O5O51_10500 [Sinirhodobacter sp. HNIBRBA609]